MKVKKYLVVCILFLFIGAGILPKVISEKPTNLNKIYIDDDALYPGQGTENRPYRYIWQGIQNASHSSLIFVRNGTYNEQINVTKSLTLQNYDDELPILDFLNFETGIIVHNPDVKIMGFHMYGGDKHLSIISSTIIASHGANNLEIEDNILEFLGEQNNITSIYIVTELSNVHISKNKFINYEKGITLEPHSHAIINDNSFSNVNHKYYHAVHFEDDDNYYGSIQDVIDMADHSSKIYVYSGIYHENLLISKLNSILLKSVNGKESTIIDGNGYRALELFYAYSAEISGFTFINSSMDVIFVYLSELVHIYQNIIRDNWIGIFIFHSDKATIDYNIVKENSYRGIVIEMSINCDINNNFIWNNGEFGVGGIGLQLVSAEAKISRNDFRQNNVNLAFEWCTFNNFLFKSEVNENNFVSPIKWHFSIQDIRRLSNIIKFHYNYYDPNEVPNLFDKQPIYIVVFGCWRMPIITVNWFKWPSPIIDWARKTDGPFDIRIP